MTSPNPKCFHMSASSTATFKACVMRYRLAYREGLRAADDTESQRVGTNWHGIHEVYRSAWGSLVSDEDLLKVVIDHLNTAYDGVPPGSKTAVEWDLERQTLLTCFIGYLWYYQDDEIQYLDNEIPFDLPLHHPVLGLPLLTTEVKRVGKIDHLVEWQGMIGPVERKSTTRDIEVGSDFWQKSLKDTQVSMYALAISDLLKAGQLGPIASSWPREELGNTLYDVWRRPQTKPAMLTQKDTHEFLETHTYHNEQFEVEALYIHDDDLSVADLANYDPKHMVRIVIDGVKPEIKPGKKGLAIRETVGMYCARLLADIYERPGRYFQRREISRTPAQLQQFRATLWNIYQTQKNMAKTGGWYECETQCRATFPCTYIPICEGPGADAVCDGETTPDGFKRIFVDLTTEGQGQTEEN